MLLTAAATVCSAASAEDNAITVKVDGKVVDFPDQEPTIVNDRTLVPVRFIAESLGYDVEWNPTDNSAVIDGGKIIMYIGTNKAKINGKNVTLDVASTLINDRTMVPLRVIAETLNCTVDWFSTNRMILVNTKTITTAMSLLLPKQAFIQKIRATISSSNTSMMKIFCLKNGSTASAAEFRLSFTKKTIMAMS